MFSIYLQNLKIKFWKFLNDFAFSYLFYIFKMGIWRDVALEAYSNKAYWVYLSLSSLDLK